SFLLPYVEQGNLFRQINFALPVASPSSEAIRLTPIPLYSCPGDGKAGVYFVLDLHGTNLMQAATNSYAACFGDSAELSWNPDRGNGVFFQNSRVRIADITDGTSTTIALGERASFFAKAPWAGTITGGTVRTTPGAPVFRSTFHPPQMMPLVRIGRKALHDPFSEPYDFYSPHGERIHFVYSDGSARVARTKMEVSVLRALSTRSGGEVVSGDAMD
ncbi:MAG: DUF1559 domain-containing protein, partial [Gemmataceae bacterium]